MTYHTTPNNSISLPKTSPFDNSSVEILSNTPQIKDMAFVLIEVCQSQPMFHRLDQIFKQIERKSIVEKRGKNQRNKEVFEEVKTGKRQLNL